MKPNPSLKLKIYLRKLTRKNLKFLKPLLIIILILISLTFLKQKKIQTMTRDLKEEVIDFINQHVDYCLQFNSREEQNKHFMIINTKLPIKPIKMTLGTAVFKFGDNRVIKRVIMKQDARLPEDEISLEMKHVNLVKTYEAFRRKYVDINGNKLVLIWLISEFIDQKITQKFVNRDENKIRFILKGILNGLDYMHSKGIAHLDLKIANVMIKNTKNEPIVKIIDFGYSRKINGNEVYIENKAYGTYPYKPPETVFQNYHGFKGDIWCVGDIAWFLSLGHTPFYDEHGNKDIEAYKDFLNGVDDLSFDEDVSFELRDFIIKCTNRNREKRPSVKELLNHEFIVGKIIEERSETDSEYETDSGYKTESWL